MKTVKRSFTLLEILIALSLLGIMATLVGVQSVQMIRSHRFDRGISQLFTALQEAQALSLTYASDHALEIGCEKGTFFYQITTDEPFSSHLLDQKKIPLEGVKQLFFDKHKQQKLHFAILPSGSVEPTGVLQFSGDKETEKRFLDLQGGTLLKCSRSAPSYSKKKIPDKPRSLVPKVPQAQNPKNQR